MKIKKAVITAAAPKQRSLPLQTLIDKDGSEKSVLSILIEEVLRGGVERIAVVVFPGDEQAYARVAGELAGAIDFIPQPQPLGYGHALLCARDFVAGDPFLHLVGDHVYVSRSGEDCASRLLRVAEAERCSVSSVQATRENLLGRFGAVGGSPVGGNPDLYRIETVVEKPTPTEAELRLIVPGLRAGYYLCFFGMHALTPTVMEILGAMSSGNGLAAASLSAALQEVARREKYLALRLADRRYDLGSRYGLLSAQLALAMCGRDRSEVLAQITELLAAREMDPAGN